MIRKYRNQTRRPTHGAVRKSHITCTVTKRLLSPVPQSWRPCHDYKNDNRLEVAEVLQRSQQGRRSVAVQNQSRPVF